MASQRVLEELDRIEGQGSNAPDLILELRDLYKTWNQNARQRLDAVADQFPEYATKVQQLMAARLCLQAEEEVIQELELPRYDLEIIPLDSTFTPMPNGDYLARWGDHARTRREIARHSAIDAEAYEEYGKLMVQMAMAVKPMLGLIPPEPTSWNPKLPWKSSAGSLSASRNTSQASTGWRSSAWLCTSA